MKGPLYILYASQSGNAETIAKQLHCDAEANGVVISADSCIVMTLDAFEKKGILSKHAADGSTSMLTLVIVCSTTGDGEVPDNGAKFKRYLRNTTDKFVNVRFTMLALGDTNYNSFCLGGKYIDQKLEAQGATRFYPRGEADDAMGLDTVVDPWIAGLWGALKIVDSAPLAVPAPVAPSIVLRATPDKGPLYFLYASQTGNSETISKQLHCDAEAKGAWRGNQAENSSPLVAVMTLDAFEKKGILSKHAADGSTSMLTLVIVCSTTGDGEVPDNGAKFKRYLRNTTDKFVNVRFTMLALGDTNYNSFCLGGKYIDQKLEAQGATRFYPRGEADDAMGLDTVVDPWIAGLWGALENLEATAPIETFQQSEEPHLPMDTPLKTVILYDPDTPGLQHLAAFLFEQILDLGGVAAICPMSHASEAALNSLSPQALLFLWGTGKKTSTLCNICQAHHRKRVEAAATSSLLGFAINTPNLQSPKDINTASFASWLSTSTSVLCYASLGVVVSPESQPQLSLVDTAVTAVLQNSSSRRLVDLGSKFLRQNGTITTTSNATTPGHSFQFAFHRQDVFTWCQLLLDYLPGIVADIKAITTSLEAATFPSLFCDGTSSSSSPNTQKVDGSSPIGTPVIANIPLLPKQTTSHHSVVTKGGNAASSSSSKQPATRPDHLVHSVLSRNVFLYTGNASHFVVTVAHDLHGQGQRRGYDGVITELENFKKVGFPRSASFVFVVGPDFAGLPKSVAKFFKAMKKFQAETTNNKPVMDSVKFAILGIDDRRTTTNFNFTALELECTLLGLGARKIHATALVDVGGNEESMQQIVTTWSEGLWYSLASPMSSVAYIDAPSTQYTPVASSSADGTTATPTEPQHASSSFFPWEPVQLRTEAVADMNVLLLYSSAGIAKTIALQARAEADQMGVRTELLSFSKAARRGTELLLKHSCIVSFVECAPGSGESLAGGRSWRRYLMSMIHAPDLMSHIHFAVLAVGSCGEGDDNNSNSSSDKPHRAAISISDRMSELQGNRVFPVTPLAHLSQLYSIGMPWFRGVLSAFSNLVVQGGKLVSPALSPQMHPGGGVGDNDDLPLVRLPPSARPSSAASSAVSILFLYGSVTGNAEAIARDLHGEALQVAGVHSRVASLNQFEKMKFLSTTYVVVVCSTTCTLGGVGGAFPNNALRFVKYLDTNAKTTTELLSNVQFAVLALGSRKYPSTFCAAGIAIDDRLHSLGGQRLIEVGCADEVEGLDITVEAWRKKLFDAVLWMSKDSVLVSPAPLSAMPTPNLKPSVPPFGTITGSSPLHDGSSAVDDGTLVIPALLDMPGALNTTVLASTTATMTITKLPRVLILFGSQKGNAEAIAGHMHQQFQDHSELYDTLEIGPLNDFESLHWRRYQVLLIVCSTTGEGEFPDNSYLFYKFLRKPHPEDLLNGMKYAVLGLGDTNYSRFCQAAKTLDRRLEEVGASRFYARGEADDAFSLEAVVEPWIENLWPALKRATTQQQPLNRTVSSALKESSSLVAGEGGALSPSLSAGRSGRVVQAPRSDTSTSTTATERMLTKTLGNTKTVTARIRGWRKLTGDASQHTVIHLDMEVPPATKWSPGDTVSILPCNETGEVEAILQRLKTDGDEPFLPPNALGVSSLFPGSPLYSRISYPITNRDVLSQVVSLRIQRTSLKSILSVLMGGTDDPTEKTLLASWSPAITDRVTLLTLLRKFNHTQPLFRHVVEHLMVLQPRSYSICSSQLVDPTCLSICFKVEPFGLCTNWMYKLCKFTSSSPAGVAAEIPLAFRETAEFRVPTDVHIPLILIGPGTGVAPFISFLQHRRCMMRQLGIASPGEAHLFFGCQTAADYLYHAELDNFLTDSTLKQLHVAFSQDDNPGFWYGGQYVQDKLQEIGQHLCDLMMHHNAHIFVCGDAEGMARDVHRVLIDMLELHLRWSTSRATQYIEAMAEDGRYQRDIWTSSW